MFLKIGVSNKNVTRVYFYSWKERIVIILIYSFSIFLKRNEMLKHNLKYFLYEIIFNCVF